MLQALKNLMPWSTAAPPVPEVIPDWHWTHDQWVLEQYSAQLIFVPDNMKKGGKYHGVLKDIAFGDDPRNPSVYTHSKFLAYKQDLGEFSNAIIMPGDYMPSGFITKGMAPEPAKIRGELWSVDAYRIYLLDKFKQNGVQFVRQRVRITYPFRQVTTNRKQIPLPVISPHCFVTITAWMYVGIPRYWDSRIGGPLAKAMDTYTHSPPRHGIGEFYDFSIKNK
jgi:gamma-glutamylcyclotransferase (GGCT)/AIG2-like uncharacterized protein YtfP